MTTVASKFMAEHPEPPSEPWVAMRDTGERLSLPDYPQGVECWENDRYHCTVRRFKSGWFVGNGPYVVLGITANDQTARHDWRDFQRIKNDVCGRTWEAVELYPSERRLVDPSNRFYLWCAPQGYLPFGFDHRDVRTPKTAQAPQRPFAPGSAPLDVDRD